MKHIGFISLGLMGTGMPKTLVMWIPVPVRISIAPGPATLPTFS